MVGKMVDETVEQAVDVLLSSDKPPTHHKTISFSALRDDQPTTNTHHHMAAVVCTPAHHLDPQAAGCRRSSRAPAKHSTPCTRTGGHTEPGGSRRCHWNWLLRPSRRVWIKTGDHGPSPTGSSMSALIQGRKQRPRFDRTAPDYPRAGQQTRRRSQHPETCCGAHAISGHSEATE